MSGRVERRAGQAIIAGWGGGYGVPDPPWVRCRIAVAAIRVSVAMWNCRRPLSLAPAHYERHVRVADFLVLYVRGCFSQRICLSHCEVDPFTSGISACQQTASRSAYWAGIQLLRNRLNPRGGRFVAARFQVPFAQTSLNRQSSPPARAHPTLSRCPAILFRIVMA